jgi:predicted nucleic acid-binding protein
MADNLQVLIDLNVILDVLQRREPFYEMSARVLASVETSRITGWVTAHSPTTLFYFLAKHRSADQARVALTELLNLLSVAPVDHAVIEQALNLPYQDLVGAVQMMAAVQIGADCVITRNPRDYRPGLLAALLPAELLALL